MGWAGELICNSSKVSKAECEHEEKRLPLPRANHSHKDGRDGRDRKRGAHAACVPRLRLLAPVLPARDFVTVYKFMKPKMALSPLQYGKVH